MEYRYAGIILDKKNVGETDRLYTIYTLEAGKIRALAKSVRKSQSKMAGFLENFALVNLTISKGQGTGRISSVITENNFSNLRNNLESLRSAFKIYNLFNKLIPWENPDRDIFKMLVEYLESLDWLSLKNINEKENVITLGLFFKTLEYLGYKIEAEKCVICRNKLFQSGNIFDASRGGAVCQKCNSLAINPLKLSANSIKIIRIFSDNSIKSLNKLTVDIEDRKNLWKTLDYFIKWIAQ